MERVIDIFVAPSKTFKDIRDHSRSWWLPFILIVVFSYIFFFVVNSKVGMQQVVDNQTHLSPKAEERLANLPADQRATTNKIQLISTEIAFYASPALILVFAALGSLVLWGTINFGFGGKAKYGSIFTVWLYAGLPGLIKVVLGCIVIYVVNTPESFNVRNYAPTNVGAFLNPLEVGPAVYAMATAIDFTTIWTLVVAGIGAATVAGVKRSSGYIAVFGWWVLLTILGVGIAAATS
jgi:cell division protein FtsB